MDGGIIALASSKLIKAHENVVQHPSNNISINKVYHLKYKIQPESNSLWEVQFRSVHTPSIDDLVARGTGPAGLQPGLFHRHLSAVPDGLAGAGLLAAKYKHVVGRHHGRVGAEPGDKVGIICIQS